MKVALDTNVLIYAEGVDDPHRHAQASQLVARLSRKDTYVPVQVLGEFYRVLVGKGGRSPAYARQRIIRWQDAFAGLASTSNDLSNALDLASEHRLSIWDALILSVASNASCQLLVSEDMQHGFAWRGTTVVNPFASEPHPLLADLLR